ncbi:hypothetical protein G6F57_012745 [Rhizopus arrhizus]|uniref:Uncharacterized protein n=1 Tax=Rhizopus oryzae TaxID=64495 RepID=A0A9P7BM25_RHIOR|nr:hypothetical protein G6F30_012082 [Rhizopus arrhizus]KAG1402075.1 hypothetical protein G6F58_010632 [Rhizopus delemar]KAG0976601.1 hypothetical protein G6F29_010684 [Rhizopus arrhizus]KAG0978680.1 hypothetical protein G6F28_012081 [Rhizopus arrhizus]KAG1002211.1 hypothetical protein G6F27_012169 [Rhizopus arrhizus]
MVELGTHLDEKHTVKERAEVEEGFKLLRNDDKWMLSTGKIVEDSLYTFGKLHIADHPSQSLIFDAENAASYIENNVFTLEEIQEIEAFKPKEFERLPNEIREYLNKFNCQSTNALRSVLYEKQSWEENYQRDQHFDLDWIKHSVYTLLRQYESGSLKKDHLENWYNVHIWSIIDSAFDDLEELEIISKVRKPMGYRFDFLIRESNPKSTCSLEYGASEVAKDLELNGNKVLKEGGEKLPKVLKDMLDLLIERKQGDCDDLSTVGIVHSGLHLRVILADRPKGYVTRVTSYKELRLSTDITGFGEQVLPVLVQIYKIKTHVKKVYNLVKEKSKNKANESDWLDNCIKNISGIITPVTSTSTETPFHK